MGIGGIGGESYGGLQLLGRRVVVVVEVVVVVG